NSPFFLLFVAVLLYFVYSNSLISGHKKASYVSGIIFIIILISINIYTYDSVLIPLIMLGVGITFLGMLYLTPSWQDVRKNITLSDKLKNPLWVGLTVAMLVFGAGWFGNLLYFSVRPAFGGGKQKPALFICDFETTTYEYLQSMVSNDNLRKDRIVGVLLGETDELYFIKTIEI
ncbi:unnamed protein product, partial [marine sediment metagenome]